MGNVTHQFVSAVADSPDTSLVRPINWNAAHAVPTNSIVKNNFGASTNPTVNDDTGDGYEVGSRWVNTTTDIAYICLDATAAAAIWTRINLGWFNVEAYGAVHDGSTNDTSAIQSAIDACETAGGGVVYFPKGVYAISGALQDTSRSNSQLLLPRRDYVDTEQLTIHLLGEQPPPPIFSVIGATPLPDGHAVLKGTLSSVSGTEPSMLGGWGPSGTFEEFTNVLVRIENLTFRLPENPVYTAANLSRVGAVELDNVVADVSDYQITGITEPTTSTSYGIRLPKLNNGALTHLDTVNVAGYYKGIEVGEHTVGVEVAAWGCKQGLVTIAGYHASHFDRLMFVHCERGIVATGGTAYLSIDQLNVEHAASGWWITDFDVDDASNYLVGRAEWKVTLAGTGHDSTWTVSGATNFLMNEMGDPTFILTIEDEGTPLATGATTLDFVGAGVTVSGAGIEKTITIAIVTAATLDAHGVVGPLVIIDTPSTPIIFGDIVQTETEDDLVYADLYD